MTEQEKKAKSKQIKKVLKERLNIVDLRMLCDHSTEDDDSGYPSGKKSANNLHEKDGNDSFHVLMKEIGVANDEGVLSAAFLEKNGEAKREELDNFADMFSVRDLLGFGAFGVVLLVKNRITKEKSALKIIAKTKLS